MPHDHLDFDPESLQGSLLLANAMEVMSLDELTSMHRQALDTVAQGVEEGEFLLTLYTIELTQRGKSGNQALWDAIEMANPRQLRAMLVVLILEPGRRTQVRRFLYQLLDHDDPEYVIVGIEGFTNVSDRKARHRVLELRQHPAPQVRSAVLGYIRGVWHNEALEALVEAFDDPAAEVRQMAIGLLLDLSIVTTLEPVRQGLSRLRQPHDIRDYARNVLNRYENPTDDLTRVVLQALSFVNDELDGKVRWKDVERAERDWDDEAAEELLIALALERPNDRHLRKRIGELWSSDDDLEKSLAINLMTIQGDRELEAEIMALREHEGELINHAAHIFQRMFDPVAVVPLLIELLEKGKPDGKLFAIQTLNHIYVAEVDEQLQARLETMRDDSDEKVRELAAFGLASEWERRFTKLEVPLPPEPGY